MVAYMRSYSGDSEVLPSQSPFPCHWWGIGLENVGLVDVRPDVGTYGRYEFERLPPIPFPMCGDFAWLALASTRDQNIGHERSIGNAEAIPRLLQSSSNLGLRLPEPFTMFMETPALQRRIRSNTDCFLDLGEVPILSPVGGGHLIRFLADSQGCLFWYLYVTGDSSDHAVVSSPGFYGTEAEQWQEEPADPREIVFSAESFETFLARFWLENEIWFSEYEKTPMSAVGQTYIEHYRKGV
jgi:hypothetical protein